MSYLPLFPLNMVAYPGEKLNLHIFEPRYRQLIGECLEQKTTFGMPAYVNNSLPGYGTEMHVSELVTRYDDGRLDIRVRGLRVFRLLDFENPAPGKLYACGDAHFYPKPEKAPPVLPQLIELVEKLYHLFKTGSPFNLDSPQPFSYQIAHGVGLPLEGEYELLTLETEQERQEFLIEHLSEVLPVVENMERTKERIRMNGDFREFGELNL
ncbi:MAG TPA: LON peptidase substrate-binding domain-containing protein [Saprospiraceae bacterium]|nr:LON peptidase substrate-binding domain-containing protein [Saprospiraceae bacterium]